MGASQSAQDLSEDEQQDDAEEEEEEEDDEDENDDVRHDIPSDARDQTVSKKTLEQEPEILPCHASASPLSPQLSAHGTPRTGPSIKVWDPCNVLSPPRTFLRSFSAAAEDDRALTEVYLISHGECHMNLRPDLISGRCPDASLTPNGKRQARALAVFLKSRGVRFNAVYTSPLDRVRATALSVCQELNFSEEQVQSSDALTEMSQGQWEGCHRSEIYTPETVSLMEKFQPDFSPPSGESLRQVEFRMVQFLNCTVMSFPNKYRSDFSPPDMPSLGPPPAPPNWDLQHKHRVGLHRKKSGKSRLQMVMKTGDNEADDEMSPRVPLMQGLVRDLSVRTNNNNNHNKNNNTDNNNNNNNPSSSSSSCVGVFTHPTPIKCLVTGVLGCSPVMLNKICVEDSSVTVLQHSWRGGWQIKRLNDTSHLRLL